jgi:hypothetical protein
LIITDVSEESSVSIFKNEETPVLVFPLRTIFFMVANPSTVKMEAKGSSEALVHIYQKIRHHITDDNTLQSHCRENFKSHLMLLSYRPESAP